MPLGIVSDTDFASELNKSGSKGDSDSKALITPAEVLTIERGLEKGRGKGNVEVPNTLRNIIGETGAIDGRASALDLASRFGIGASSVSAYTKGATSTASYNDTPNEPVISRAKLRVSNRARGKLMRALHHITEDKLTVAKARDLAGIAKDMSAVIKTMEPDSPHAPGVVNNNAPAFVFYAPAFKREEDYETVYSKD